MKGIILAGRTDNRLYPLTSAIPKQLMPIYDKPMIYYPLQTLKECGITEIMVITAPEYKEVFIRALGDGSQFGVNISYAIQAEARGIAEALIIAKDFIRDTDVCLITGDTILVGESFSPYMTQAVNALKKSGSASVFTKRSQDYQQYGKVIKGDNGKNLNVVGNDITTPYHSIVGIYVYPADVVKYVEQINLSERGRIEITDLNKIYFSKNKLQVIPLDDEVAWLDTNTFKNLLDSANFIYKHTIIRR